jgi:PAS domain S-box-containing protein
MGTIDPGMVVLQLQRQRRVITLLLVMTGAGATWIALLLGQAARRRKADAIALDKEARLSTILESTKDLLMAVDLEFRLTYCNAPASEHFRTTYGKEAFLGAAPEQILPAERAGLWRSLYQKAITGGSFQMTMELPDGRFLEQVINPIQMGGKIRGVAVFSRDISEARRFQLDLEASERRYRDIFNRAPVGIYTRYLDGPYLLTNPVTWAQFECGGREEFEADYGTIAQRWAQPERHAGFASRLLRDHQVLGEEVEVMLKSGKRKWLLLYAFLNESDPGTLSGFTVDITSLRLAENARLEALEHLHQVQKLTAIGELAGGVAHDFNNALAGISGVVELLRDEGRSLSDEKQGNYFRLICEACRRGTDLTRKLLTFARKGNEIPQPIDLNQVVEDTVELLRRTMDRRIIIIFEPLEGAAPMLGNASMLGNAFMNLGINASHAMPEGGELAFKVRARTLAADECRASCFDIQPGCYLEVEVADSGCGMPPAVQDRIFEPFFTTKPAGKGTGLGLAQVHGTVRDHHGAVEVVSEVGVGTRFRLLLPTSGTSPETAE